MTFLNRHNDIYMYMYVSTQKEISLMKHFSDLCKGQTAHQYKPKISDTEELGTFRLHFSRC